jgi:hypothetical protein
VEATGLVPANRADSQSLHPAGRYKAAQEKFRDVAARASVGEKYGMDDEIHAIRTQLAMLIERLGPDSMPDTDDDKVLRSWAAARSGDQKALTALLKELREILEVSARFEGQVSILRVKSWAAGLMRIIRDEVKDDGICQRISSRLGSLAI